MPKHTAPYLDFAASAWKTSGRTAFKNMRRALGMPFQRQFDTEADLTSHKRVTAIVPPSASMISEWGCRVLIAISSMIVIASKEGKQFYKPWLC